MTSAPQPTSRQIRRWQQYLANERAEAAVYFELAQRTSGETKEILLSLAEAEARHEAHWRQKLGSNVGMPKQASFETRFLGFLARRFGSLFTLALMQAAEQRTPYLNDDDATEEMRADERIHAEVVRGLAAKGREQLSGGFRAAVFGANDGLVSSFALLLGMVGAGAAPGTLIATGFSGLLAGAMSMAAGEYVSVSSQQDLLDANRPDAMAANMVPQLDVNRNELALVYRARGMSEQEAEQHAEEVFAGITLKQQQQIMATEDAETEVVGKPHTAAISSFCCFAVGAFIPLLPFLFGLHSAQAALASGFLVALSLLFTGSVVGLISGKSPVKRALRQLVFGLGAAFVTYGLGLLFGATVS